MHLAEMRCSLEIPLGVRSEDIMKSLELGHGYKWTILIRSPLLVAHGNPTLGNMPELLMTGNRSLVIAGEDPVYIDRLRKVLNMLQRHSQRFVTKKEEIQYG